MVLGAGVAAVVGGGCHCVVAVAPVRVLVAVVCLTRGVIVVSVFVVGVVVVVYC